MTIGQLWQACLSGLGARIRASIPMHGGNKALRQPFYDFLHLNDFKRGGTSFIENEYLQAGGHRTFGEVEDYCLELLPDKTEDMALTKLLYVCLCYENNKDRKVKDICLFIRQQHTSDEAMNWVSLPQWYEADKFIDDMRDTPVKDWYRSAEEDDRDVGLKMPTRYDSAVPARRSHPKGRHYG